MPSFSRRKTYSLQNERAGTGAQTLAPYSRTSAARRSMRRTNTISIGGERTKKQAKAAAKIVKATKRKGYSTAGQNPLISTDSMVLHELIPSTPMPGEAELNHLFSQIVDELGLNRELMVTLPPEKKWQLYLSKHKDRSSLPSFDSIQPQFYVEELMHLNEIIHRADITEIDFEINLKLANDLKTALRTQPLSFVLQFIELNGLEYLLEFLRSMSNEIRQSQLHYVIMGCIKAIMNNADGRAHVLAHPAAITVIAQSLRTTNVKTKILTLEILGALCLIPGGHKKVLNAMILFQQYACERTRFQTLGVDLARSLDEDQDSANLQIAILSFLNALINYKAGEESLEFRLHLRHELIMLGIQPVINRLRSLGIPQLNKHLDIFEYVRIEDEREFSARLHVMERVDYSNVIKMADLLQRKTAYTPSYQHLISLLYHCLLIPVDDPHYEKYWRLIDRMVQQAVIQQDHGVDPDVSPLPINIQKLVVHLLHEDEQKALIKQMEDMKRAQEHMVIRLKKMEWECERTTLQRDAHKTTSEKLRQQLEMKLHDLARAGDKALEMEGKVLKLTKQVNELTDRCEQLETRLKDKNVDISDLPTPSPAPTPPPAPPLPTSAPAPPPPPPPPGAAGGMPPPPPPVPGSSRKNVIESGLATLRRSKQQLKSFNWEKMNIVRRDSIWATIDERSLSAVYDEFNFEGLEERFTQKPSRETSYATLRRQKVAKEKVFIGDKRAQNCTILLSKLKLTDQEIRLLILTMDTKNNLDKEMLEQLLKFVPMSDEIKVLRENLGDLNKFCRADRYMFEMSQIPRFEQRLKALYLTRSFNDRVADIRPHIEDVTASCHELMMSSKLRRILEVVLAVGNYMNRGMRGNALGFKLTSLNKIAETRSTDSETTLLHYLTQNLEAKFPEVLTLEADLPHIRKAAKVDMSELEKDFREIKQELDDVKKELEFHRTNPSGDESDSYVNAVEDFALHAAITMRETEHLLRDMKEQFRKALVFFGEDPNSKAQTAEKFFGVFEKFLKSLSDCHLQIITNRHKKEEEEKRKKEEEQRKTETLRRKKQKEKQRLSNAMTGGSGDGDLDELIERLYNGDIEYGQHLKRRSKRSSGAANMAKAWLQVSRERIDRAEADHIKGPENESESH